MNDNPPAFPTRAINEHERYLEGGMTLRDYFAAAALQAIVSKTKVLTRDSGVNETNMQAARGAYEYADAMLLVRSGE